MAPTVLGLDEAGRGSVIGPLVVGGFLTTAERAPRLPEIGVADSKLLSAARREQVFRQLPGWGRRVALEIPPSRIDAYVRSGRLNQLEAEAFATLIRRVRPGRAVVDACDPVAERFGRLVFGLAEGLCPVEAAHRADRNVPVVGAASIVAKVRRDRAVARLRESTGVDFGSGYPADPKTVEFVRATLREPAVEPAWLRQSWATTERLKPGPRERPLESFPP